MADETIGVARIDLTADASGVDAAVAKAKNSIASMSKDAQAEYSRLSAAEKRRIDTLVRQADTVGMTRAQQVAYNASLKSSGAVLDDITGRLRQNATAAQKAGIEFNKYGISAKQELAALRQTPAQLTDILVSLQGGQRPLTVLLQQGGQLRDIFGGIVPAAKAMGGALLGLVNPATLSVGALVGLAVAYAKGAEEAQAFGATLITTGNAIGVSVDGLQTLARNVGAATTGQHDAAEVINQFAKAGKVSAENLGDYAKAAIQWSQATGESTQSIVDNFTKLADDPLKALVKLDEQMHFLTATEYEHAKALDDVGDKTEGASYSQKLYANALADRTPKMVENLGLVERAWKAIKGETNQAISALMSIGRDMDLVQKLTDAQARLKIAENSPGNSKAKQAGIAAQQAVVADLQQQILLQGVLGRQQAGADQLRIQQTEAAVRWGKQQEKIQSNAVKRANEIAQARRDALVLGKSEKELAEQIAAINEKYKDPKVAAVKNDGATRLLMTLRAREASLRAQADDTEKLTSDQKTLAAWEQKLADIKNKKVLTADEKSYLLHEQDIRLQLQRNVAAEREAEQKKALIALGQRSAQIDQQMASAREAAAEQYQRLLDSFGLGDKATQRVEAQRSIYREFQKRQDDLTKQAAKGGTLGSDAYKNETAKIQAELERRLAMQKSYYETVDELQSSWALGASQGMANYSDDAMNAFKNVGSFATNTFKQMEDDLTEFFMTGKFNATDFVNYVEKELIRLAVQQNITGPLAKLMGGGGGGGGGFGDFLGNIAGTALSMFGGGETAAAEAAGNTAGAFGGDSIGAMLKFLPAPSANGNVFASKDLSSHSGEIWNSPTYFKFARGAAFGVGGEAGPEAIMPLKRLPNGRLGVQAHSGPSDGGQNASSARPVVIQMTVNTPDATSFRKSQNQIAREMSLMGQRAVART